MVKVRLYYDNDSVDIELDYTNYCKLKDFVSRQFHMKIYEIR